MIMYSSLSDEVAHALLSGAIGVIPCDTLYGLVCCAQNKQAVSRLYKAKHRDNKPGTIIAVNTQQLVELGLKEDAVLDAARFWPNPVSVVIAAGDELSYLHSGKNALAVRIPKDTKLVTFLEKTGPLLTTSANMPGEEPVTTVAAAKAVFGESVDLYVDGGDYKDRLPSTVLRVQEGKVEILRVGAVRINETGSIQ